MPCMSLPVEFEPWTPNLAPKQWEVFNCYKRAVLLTGPRKSSKTIACAHKVWRHLWDTPGARVALISRTYKVAKSGGVWEDVINIVGAQWLSSGMTGDTGEEIAYTTQARPGGPFGPKTDLQTRTVFFRIRNRHGGESELILFSLDDDSEVEAKLKSTRFSMIWFSELSNFQTRKVFDISLLQLRMPHLNFEDHMWIADTNPAEEGEDSWIWKLWFQERVAENHPDPEFQKNLELFQFTLDDNPFLDPRERRELEGVYIYDPGEYDRNVLGHWTKGHGFLGKVFADMLAPDTFIDGAIDIGVTTDKLYSGWDLGVKYHACVLLERRMIEGRPVWLVLDEIVALDEKISTAAFTYQVVEKIMAIEKHYGRAFKWQHWSDNTALTVYRPGIDGYDASEVLLASGGQISLEAADKPEGSVKAAVKHIRRLLRERRLFVGKNCPYVIEMFEQIAAGKKYAVEDTRLKDVFDALRYPIFMTDAEEMAAAEQIRSSPRVSAIVHV